MSQQTKNAKPQHDPLGFSYTATGDKEVTLTRSFNAPRDRVFAAMTTRELLRRWFGDPNRSSEGEIKEGVEWRSLDKNGRVTMRGVVKELVAPQRFVSTESSLGAPPYPDEILAACVYEERNGTTLFIETFSFDSRKNRDIAIESGLESVYQEAFTKLDDILAHWPEADTKSSGDANKRVVTEFFRVMSERDEPGMRKCMTRDVTWTLFGTLPVSGIHRGQDAIFRDIFGLWDKFESNGGGSQDITKMLAEDDSVSVECHITGNLKNGKRYDMYYSLLFDLRDGRIAAVREYVDTMHMKDTVFD